MAFPLAVAAAAVVAVLAGLLAALELAGKGQAAEIPASGQDGFRLAAAAARAREAKLRQRRTGNLQAAKAATGRQRPLAAQALHTLAVVVAVRSRLEPEALAVPEEEETGRLLIRTTAHLEARTQEAAAAAAALTTQAPQGLEDQAL